MKEFQLNAVVLTDISIEDKPKVLNIVPVLRPTDGVSIKYPKELLTQAELLEWGANTYGEAKVYRKLGPSLDQFNDPNVTEIDIYMPAQAFPSFAKIKAEYCEKEMGTGPFVKLKNISKAK